MGLPVDSSIVGNLTQQLAIGQSLTQKVQSVANVATSVANDPVGATAAFASTATGVAQDISTLVESGVTVSGVTIEGIAGALQAAGSFLQGTSLNQLGGLLVGIGSGVAAGAMGGPFGAAIGGIVGGIEAVIASQSPAGVTLTGFTPSTENMVQLGQLQAWCKQWHITSGNQPGQTLYQYAAYQANLASPTNLPIPSDWLWGLNLGGPTGVITPSGDPAVPMLQSVIDDIPVINNGNAQANTLLSRTPPMVQYLSNNANLGYNNNPGMREGLEFLPIVEGKVDWSGVFALGTVFAMLDAGASEQAIAAELLMQNYLYSTQKGGGSARPGITQLAEWYLSRVPPKVPANWVGAFNAGSAATTAPSSSTGTTLAMVGGGIVGLTALGIFLHARSTHSTFAQSAKSLYRGATTKVKRLVRRRRR